MTVTANTTRNDYIAGSSQNVYAYTFQLNDATDVTVLLGSVEQTLNTHYTVQNVGSGSGGTITFTLVDGNNNPIFPTQGTDINIFMSMDLDRDTAYQANGAFLANEVNNDYDRLWLATNQQQTAINRTLKDEDETSASMELPVKNTRKGKYLAFDDVTGNPIAIGAYSALGFVEKTGDTMTGLLNNTVGYAAGGTTFINATRELSNVTGDVSQFTNDSNYLDNTATLEGGNF